MAFKLLWLLSVTAYDKSKLDAKWSELTSKESRELYDDYDNGDYDDYYADHRKRKPTKPTTQRNNAANNIIDSIVCFVITCIYVSRVLILR